MKYKTCSCGKQGTRCVITGFSFASKGKAYRGDLFFCNTHKAFSIDGINQATMPVTRKMSFYTGEFVSTSEEYGGAAGEAELYLAAPDMQYITDQSRCLVYSIKNNKVHTLETDINYEPVIIEYTYDSGCPGSYFQPPESDSAEIQSIFYNGIDISPVLRDDVIEELAKRCLKDMESTLQAAHESAGDMAYEIWRENR